MEQMKCVIAFLFRKIFSILIIRQAFTNDLCRCYNQIDRTVVRLDWKYVRMDLQVM